MGSEGATMSSESYEQRGLPFDNVSAISQQCRCLWQQFDGTARLTYGISPGPLSGLVFLSLQTLRCIFEQLR
jgi:hypothetical protein